MIISLAALLLSGAGAEPHQLAIGRVSGAGSSGPVYLEVSGGDLDGDGVLDDGIVRFTCANDAIVTAHAIVSPHDSSSGLATGKRQHKPMTVIKEWEAASTALSAIRPTYDIKTNKGARMAVDAEGWLPIDLNAPGLCAATQKATKTRSNIQNN